MQHLTNVANGQLASCAGRRSSRPGRGLSTVGRPHVQLAREEERVADRQQLLAARSASLTRFGNPIDIHPNKADEIAGRGANRFVEFTDGDGTTHRFTGKQAADGTRVLGGAAPASTCTCAASATTDPRGRWALTRPDRVTFFFDVDGYPTMRRGRATATASRTRSEDDAARRGSRRAEEADHRGDGRVGPGATPARSGPSGSPTTPRRRPRRPRSAARSSGSPTTAAARSTSSTTRTATSCGSSRRGGTNADGTPLADRSFVFTYTTSNGDGPAIPAAADRVNPEPKTPNQSTRLFSVRDPRGNETTFTYLGAGNGQDRWKLASRTEPREREEHVRATTSPRA